MKEKNNKILIKKIIHISIIIILAIITIFLLKKIYNKTLNNKEFENSVISFTEKNEKTIFTINKIVFFSSSDSKNKSSSSKKFVIENLYTYTDLALFIDNNSEENTLENTLKSLKICNIELTKKPTIGEPNLYYKSINNFGKREFEESNKIEKELEFEITSEDNADLNKPVLYNNCANPITLTYINQNIKENYTITDIANPITYNGKLLERCNVPIDSIDTSISFEIYIESNKGQKFRTKVYFDIPYQDGEKSIYEGSTTIRQDTDFKFYRYE